MSTEDVLEQNAMDHTDEQAQVFTLPRDPHKAVHEMMMTIDQLHSLYTEENDALVRGDTKRFLSLQNNKIALALDYESGVQQISHRKAEFNVIDEKTRAKLRAMQADFSALVRENLSALERARKSVDRLNRRIMDSARKTARTTQRVKYSASGNLEENQGRVSIGLNESV